MTIHKPKKLPAPVQRADGKWIVRWRYKLSGVEHRPKRVFDSEADANGFILRELAGESTRDPRAARSTFGAYADRYLAEVATEVKARTVERYRSALTHARQYFAGVVVSDIRTSDCRAFRAALLSGGCVAANQRKITRTNSARNAYAAFRAVLELAVDDKALPENPAIISRARKRKTNREAKFCPVYLDAGQVELLAAQIDGKAPYDLLVVFLAYTGLRAGELAGLNVDDLRVWQGRDKTWRGYVDVHRTRRKATAEERENGSAAWVEDTPKSEKSRRRVKLPPWLAEDLDHYLMKVHPAGDDPTAPLWPNRKPGATYALNAEGKRVRAGFRLDWATPVEPGAFYRTILKPAAAAVGVPQLRLHDLRHTFANLWLSAGGDIYALSEQMGHEKYTTTLDFYAHLKPGDEDAPHVFAARPDTTTNVIPLRRAAG